MRRFLPVLGIAVVALGLGWGTNTAHAATLVVCNQGCPFRSIQAAINAAAPGDTIQIRRGTYDERVEITKNVALVGAGASATTIRHFNGPSVMFVRPGVSANVNALRVTGGSPLLVNAGVLVAASVELSGGIGTTTRGGGIVNDGNLTLVNSTVHNNQANRQGGGIYNEDGARLTLQGSTVHNNRVLVPLDGGGGGIFNDSERNDVRLEQGSSVTGNHPNNCVNVEGCSSPTLPPSHVPPTLPSVPVLPDLWCNLPGVPAFLCQR
jgi:hypothetical protein